MDQILPLKRMYLSGKISKKLLNQKTNELPSGKGNKKYINMYDRSRRLSMLLTVNSGDSLIFFFNSSICESLE